MAGNITVSICSLAYNHAHFIRQSLDSMLAQNVNFDYEILINDDCSTDGTTDIIKEYEEKYPDKIYLVLHDENLFSQGIRGMFHKFLFPKARGKYIALCECDDYWDDPRKLQKQVDFLENNPDYSMCFSRAKIMMHIDTPIYLKCFDTEDRDYSASELFKEWRVPTASMLFRKTSIEYKLKNEERMMNGDAVIVQQCTHSGKVRGMIDAMCVYRVQSGGVTYSSDICNARIMKYPEHYECMLENFPQIDKSLLYPKVARAYYERANIQPTDKLQTNDIKMAEKYQPGICRYMCKEKVKQQIKARIKNLLNL